MISSLTTIPYYQPVHVEHWDCGQFDGIYCEWMRVWFNTVTITTIIFPYHVRDTLDVTIETVIISYVTSHKLTGGVMLEG